MRVTSTSSRRVIGLALRLGLIAMLFMTSLIVFAPVAAAETFCSVTAFHGEYYNNQSLAGAPAMVRDDASVNFDWSYGSPGGAIPPDHFSVRWTATLQTGGGNFNFHLTTDDGARFWVDGQLIIDQWHDQSPTTYNATVFLGGGQHSLKVEYYENMGTALVRLWWDQGGAPGPGPATTEVIVDDLDAGFVRGGSGWHASTAGYRGHLFWTWNSRTQLQNWAKWFPSLPAGGNWEVYVFVASKYFGSKSAHYSIYHAGVRDDVVVNQNNYYNQWISLGTYGFNGGSGEYVYLGNNTGESLGTRFVGFDAVKFVQRSGGTPPPPGPPPPAPSGCAITPVLGFGNIWNGNATVRSKLGCPVEVEKSIWAAEQYFQGGYMFWRSDISYIYVLYNNGTWAGYNDTWTTAEPEWDSSIVAPPGFFQPKRGFGKIWRSNATVRGTLGWGTTEERGFFGSEEQFNGGIMLWSNVGGVYVLYGDGTWQRF